MHAPICLQVSGSLADVLVNRGYLEERSKDPQPRKVQVIRYYCSNPELARLVRVQLATEGRAGAGQREWTPQGAADELRMQIDLEAGETLRARLMRGPQVDAGALTVSPDDVVCLEVIG